LQEVTKMYKKEVINTKELLLKIEEIITEHKPQNAYLYNAGYKLIDIPKKETIKDGIIYINPPDEKGVNANNGSWAKLVIYWEAHKNTRNIEFKNIQTKIDELIYRDSIKLEFSEKVDALANILITELDKCKYSIMESKIQMNNPEYNGRPTLNIFASEITLIIKDR